MVAGELSLTLGAEDTAALENPPWVGKQIGI